MLKAAPEISTAMQAYTLRGWEGGEEGEGGKPTLVCIDRIRRQGKGVSHCDTWYPRGTRKPSPNLLLCFIG